MSAAQDATTATAATADGAHRGSRPWSVEVRRTPAGGPDVTAAERLAADLRVGLAQDPPSIPPKWFYDDKGSLLFDEITRLEEYYPTRTEEAILRSSADEIAALSEAATLVELGAGYSRKTRLLLEALTSGGRELLYVPLDVAEEPLRDTAVRVVAAHPTVEVRALVADFEDDLRPLPGEGAPRLVAFLGSTIGNLLPDDRAAFLSRLCNAMDPGDALLLGADLVKDPGRLVAAYDDARGVTAAFNKNVVDVLARELGADLDPDDFDHVAVWNADAERIEMRLRARRDLTVRIDALDLDWWLPAGSEVLTETSHKFRVEGVQAELRAAGLTPVRTWTDEADDFSLTLARREA